MKNVLLKKFEYTVHERELARKISQIKKLRNDAMKRFQHHDMRLSVAKHKLHEMRELRLNNKR